MMKNFTALILITLLFSKFTFGQSNYKVEGSVRDALSKEGIANAAVLLYESAGAANKLIQTTTADRNGFYSIDNIGKGVYTIAVQVIGYKTEEKKFTTEESYLLKIDFELFEEKIILDDVFVVGQKTKNIEISTVDLSIELIKKLPSMSGEMDVYRALTMLPGVTTASELSNGLYVRGGSPDQTLTLVDGVVVYNPFHLGGFASSFNSDAVQDIKLIKGGFPAEYGGRVSSVLDIKLRDGNSTAFKGNIGIGVINSRASIEGPLNDKMTYLFSARKMYLNSLQEAFLKDVNIPFYGFHDYNGKITLKASEKDWVSISGYYGKDNLYSPPASADVGYDINWSNLFLNLNWLSVHGDKKFTRFAVNYTAYEFNTQIRDLTPYSYKQDFVSTSRIEDISLKIDGQYLSIENHTVKAGIEMVIHNFKLLNNNFYASELEKDERFENTITGLEMALYVQDEWIITPLLNATWGIRIYGFPRARYYQPEPRISLSYAMTENFFIKGAYAMGNQFLHLIIRNDVLLPTDMWFPSTPKIKPVNAQQAILGFEYTFDNQIYLISAEGYYKQMENLYEYSDTSTFTIENELEQQLTGGRGDAYGVEFFFNKRAGNLTGWIGYTLSFTKRYFDAVNKGNPFYPRYDRRHDIEVVLSYQFNKAWEAGLTWSYSTGQTYTMPTGQYYFPSLYSNNEEGSEVYLDYTNLNEYRLPPYHKLDVSLSYKFDWFNYPCTLNLSVYNVYNNQNSFAHYISYSIDPDTGALTPQLKRFTLFPFLPTLTFNISI
ncbi:MAG: TonB-dependent receptor [bacterium]